MPSHSPADPHTLSARLKNENWDLHQVAEHSEHAQSMIRGTISAPAFAKAIAQARACHADLDTACRAARAARADLAPLMADDLLQAPWYDADLAALGPNTPDPAGPNTARAAAIIRDAASDPLEVLGLHYVRTGATNGNRFVARALRAAGLPGNAMRHLDPWGEAQRDKWAAFKQTLDALPLTPAQMDTVVAAARRMYVAVINLHGTQWRDEAELLAGARLDRDAFDRSHATPTR